MSDKITIGFGKNTRKYLIESDSYHNHERKLHTESREETCDFTTNAELLAELSKAAGLITRGASKKVEIVIKAANINRPGVVTTTWPTKIERF